VLRERVQRGAELLGHGCEDRIALDGPGALPELRLEEDREPLSARQRADRRRLGGAARRQERGDQALAPLRAGVGGTCATLAQGPSLEAPEIVQERLEPRMILRP